ncbi:helix-turn-helix transcriptional regulator [Anaerovorax odorimutans]|uniref:Helix-turn-helix transcriptional regulator n=1 Tax=Anaerovorax odorimutans TaxID=109327 RepID=A0ABT1RPP4_9FIRM|nr:helix-turn-helix transcriptional regulator [Anaerovorax odorimutans]MCQ4637168.1 helix-turn-helix transcriptional regulator [Anaerovorax odorimutans]
MKYYNNGFMERMGYDLYCDIAINIVAQRDKLGITQEELAKAAKIKPSRLQRVEAVKVRPRLEEIEALAKALEVTTNNLIGAELDSQVGDCLYLIWPEDLPDFKLYQKATSKRMALFLMEQRLKRAGVTLFETPRTRVFVELIGVPVTDQELKDKLPKYKEEQALEEE